MPERLLLAAIAAVALAACGEGEPGDDAMPPQDGPGAPPESAQVPAGAIEVGDGLYMVPAGLDAGGCAQFTMWSPTQAVVMLIHYRDGKGGFTPDRAQADCPP